MNIKNRSYQHLLAAGVLAFAVTSIVWANAGTDGILITLQADDLVVVQAGKKIYQSQCAACHGKELEGQPDWRTRDVNGMLPAPPHDASGHTWHHADDLLFEITKYGAGVVINDPDYKANMPLYESILSDDEIIAVLSYIKHSWPEEERTWQDAVNGTPREGAQGIKKIPSLLDKLLK